MNIEGLKKEYVGKKLLSIIDIDLNDSEVVRVLKNMTGSCYDSVDNAKILLFEKNQALVFVGFDCDGYRSGSWHLLHIKEMLDREQTKGIKIINSIVTNIEYFDGHKNDSEYYKHDTECILITTEEYVIKMGQNNVSDYYPSNFFSVDECKEYALGFKEWEEVERK